MGIGPGSGFRVSISSNQLGFAGRRVRLDTASKQKYASVLGADGDWAWFQRLLGTLRRVGDSHGGASIANVAARWVLQRPAVGALIIGVLKPYPLHEAREQCHSFRWPLGFNLVPCWLSSARHGAHLGL
jgi:aryl-alcohol dehydrogenase-like predicted oxidoreductase